MDHRRKHKYEENSHDKEIIYAEILQSKNSEAEAHALEAHVRAWLTEAGDVAVEGVVPAEALPPRLAVHLASVTLCASGAQAGKSVVAAADADIQCRTYRLSADGPDQEELSGEGEEPSPAATHWLLPAKEFHGLWEALVYDSDVKNELLRFVHTAMLFSDAGVDPTSISWNKLVLLHGPPGTGKTSLCKALAQKISIQLNDRYAYSQLVEINSHSLFSKWFSESGKLVQKLFSQLEELVEDRRCLVIVLVDEVESLARSRGSSSQEPGDAIRVVNALLTQLDQIRRHPNVLLLTTSNLSGSVDVAFLDRADIRYYIGLPSQAAVYQIYRSCLLELARTRVIAAFPEVELLTLRQLQITGMARNGATEAALLLWDIAGQSAGLSGRALRKLPFLAHALHVRGRRPSLPLFLEALAAAVAAHQARGEGSDGQGAGTAVKEEGKA